MAAGSGLLDLLSEMRADWHGQANCRGIDPELFFPERGGSSAEAKAVCAGCVVREQCLDYALENHERFGIWGGLSERQRRHVRSARLAACAASPTRAAS